MNAATTKRRSRRRVTRAPMGHEVATAAETLFDDRQRRLVFAMLAMGIALVGVGLFVPPAGAMYFLVMLLAVMLAAALGVALGGGRGRAFDAWFVTGGGPRRGAAPLPPAAMAEAARAAVLAAMVPGLLAELARTSRGMSPREKAAAEQLLEAAVTALRAGPGDAPRAALARDLPRVMAALNGGGEAGAREAAALAERLRSTPPGAGR